MTTPQTQRMAKFGLSPSYRLDSREKRGSILHHLLSHFSFPIGSVCIWQYGHIYHEYTPFMLAYIRYIHGSAVAFEMGGTSLSGRKSQELVLPIWVYPLAGESTSSAVNCNSPKNPKVLSELTRTSIKRGGLLHGRSWFIIMFRTCSLNCRMFQTYQLLQRFWAACLTKLFLAIRHWRNCWPWTL